MKLIQLDYQKPCSRLFIVVVEVPDDFPEEGVPSLVSSNDVTALEAGSSVEELNDPPECTHVMQITSDDGSPNYRLEDGALVKVQA